MDGNSGNSATGAVLPISTPGAARSTLFRPKLEKLASWSSAVTAATLKMFGRSRLAMAFWSLPLTSLSQVKLPAAMTARTSLLRA